MKKIFRYMLVAVLGAFILCAATNSVQAADTHGINVDYYKSQNAVPKALQGKTPADKAKAAEAKAQSVSPNPNPPGSSSAYGGWGGTGVTGSSSSSSSSASGSSSDDGKIFDILQRKIYNTLVDLRKIVYMISGFGLVAFAVAAIFNKISYKHLGYIMISLCLLALMFPFLEYFSGYKLESEEQKQLTFRNFLAASDYSRIRGELDADVMNGTGERPGEPGANDEVTLAMTQAKDEYIQEAYTPQGIKVEKKGFEKPETIQSALVTADEQEKAAFAKAGCNAASVSKEGGATTTKSAWDTKTGSRTVCVMGKNGKIQKTTETCQGKLNKNGICKSTGWQKVQSLTNTTQNAIAVGTAGLSAAGNAISMAKNAEAGADALGDIARGDGKWYDKIYDMSNVTSNTFGSNGTATRDAFDILKNYNEGNTALGNIGTEVNRNYENNPTGKNKFTTGRENANKEANKNVGGTMGKIGDEINKGASTGRTVHSQATNVNENINKAKQTADAWNGLFNPDNTEAAKQQRAHEAAAQAAAQAAEQQRAEEQARKEAERKAAEQQKAIAGLSEQSIQQMLDSGVVTDQQASQMTSSMLGYRASQAQEAQQAAEQKAQEAQEKADAANQAVQAAQAALANASGADIARAVANLQKAQADAAKANEAADKANEEANAAAEDAKKASDAAADAAAKVAAEIAEANASKRSSDTPKDLPKLPNHGVKMKSAQ